MRVGQACGKLLLFGEHAAVWGYPAVGLSLAWNLKARYDGDSRPDWFFPKTPEKDQPNLRRLIARLEELAREHHQSFLPAGTLTLESSIPAGSGFGSSAALCAALVKLFFPQAAGQQLDTLAREAEKIFHGRPSGIDTALALRQGLGILWPSAEAKVPCFEAVENPHLALIGGAFEREANTKTLVLALAQRLEKNEPTASSLMKELGAAASQAAKLFRGQRLNTASAAFLQELSPLIQQAQNTLARLGLAHPAQDKLFRFACEKTGALAAKLSGAGGGGAYFLLYPDEQTAKQALPLLKENAPGSLLPPLLMEAAE